MVGNPPLTFLCCPLLLWWGFSRVQDNQYCQKQNLSDEETFRDFSTRGKRMRWGVVKKPDYVPCLHPFQGHEGRD